MLQIWKKFSLLNLFYKYKQKKLLSKKYKIRTKGFNNKIVVFDDNEEVEIAKKEIIDGLKITIFGDNNVIRIAKNIVMTNCQLCIYGNGNFFELNKTHSSVNNTMIMFQKSDNSKLVIGSNIFIGSAKILIEENNTVVEIGRDCMFSDNIQIRNSDGHVIFDAEGRVINKAHEIVIGNHVWLGFDVKILKNVKLADNVIVGAASLVSKSFDDSDIIIAGVPAKIVKKNISWNAKSVNDYI